MATNSAWSSGGDGGGGAGGGGGSPSSQGYSPMRHNNRGGGMDAASSQMYGAQQSPPPMMSRPGPYMTGLPSTAATRSGGSPRQQHYGGGGLAYNTGGTGSGGGYGYNYGYDQARARSPTGGSQQSMSMPPIPSGGDGQQQAASPATATPGGQHPNQHLYVHNVPKDSSEAELRELFGRCGNVESVRLKVNHKVGPHAVYAFVTFSSTQEAQNALEQLEGTDIRGRALRIEYQRTRGPGGNQQQQSSHSQPPSAPVSNFSGTEQGPPEMVQNMGGQPKSPATAQSTMPPQTGHMNWAGENQMQQPPQPLPVESSVPSQQQSYSSGGVSSVLANDVMRLHRSLLTEAPHLVRVFTAAIMEPLGLSVESAPAPAPVQTPTVMEPLQQKFMPSPSVWQAGSGAAPKYRHPSEAVGGGEMVPHPQQPTQPPPQHQQQQMSPQGPVITYAPQTLRPGGMNGPATIQQATMPPQPVTVTTPPVTYSVGVQQPKPPAPPPVRVTAPPSTVVVMPPQSLPQPQQQEPQPQQPPPVSADSPQAWMGSLRNLTLQLTGKGPSPAVLTRNGKKKTTVTVRLIATQNGGGESAPAFDLISYLDQGATSGNLQTLSVSHRSAYDDMVRKSFASVFVIEPVVEPAENVRMFEDYIQYFEDRQRAGVIRLGVSPDDHTAVAPLVYLFPGSVAGVTDAIRHLFFDPQPRTRPSSAHYLLALCSSTTPLPAPAGN